MTIPTFNIKAIDPILKEKLQHKIDFKTKPLGSLGLLENLALQIGLIQNTLSPTLNNPHIVVFAADHGATAEGISAFPAEVTPQMVLNFLNNGAAINTFCNQNKIALKVVDAGVNYQFQPSENLISQKIAMGTANYTQGPAMTIEQLHQAILAGSDVVNTISKQGCNIIGFGEMGIGNTASASLLMHTITKIPLNICVGKGTGLTTDGVEKKIAILERALAANKNATSPQEILAAYGGFEIAQMVGAMLMAAEQKMVVLVDGFIATSAYLVASTLYPQLKEYAIFCHKSEEKGHSTLLNHLNANPILHLNMRLGEGTGCAVAYPVVLAAVSFLNNMASFESAGVSTSQN